MAHLTVAVKLNMAKYLPGVLGVCKVVCATAAKICCSGGGWDLIMFTSYLDNIY